MEGSSLVPMEGSSISSREWSQQFEIIKRQIQSKRAACDLKLSEAQQFMTVLLRMERSLKVMAAAPMEYEIAISEIVRRQVVLSNLMSALSEHKTSQYSPHIGNITRVGVENANGKRPSSAPSATTVNTDGGLKLRQVEVLGVQEGMLKDLVTGIDRLYRQAVSIGEESKTQVRLLDHLDEDVEGATGTLQSESRHAERVRVKSSGTFLYSCIGIEIVVIIVLVIVISYR